MTNINIFKISGDGSKLELQVTTDVGQTITSVRIWNHETFKDYNLIIDVSNKLSGTSNSETIEIFPTDINTTLLDGIYFVEVLDSIGDNSKLGVAVDISRFMFCLSEYLCKVNIQCPSCDNELFKALTMKLYMDNLKYSLQLGNFTTAITYWKNLNKICKKACVECKDVSTLQMTGLGFGILEGGLMTI